MDVPHRFLFRGSAVGIAGRIRRPKDMLMPAQATVALPIIGGRADAHAVGAGLGGIVNFSSATAHASGDYDDRERAAAYTNGRHDENRLPTTTTVSATVNDLVVAVEDGKNSHTVKATKVSATFISKHPKWGSDPAITAPEPVLADLSVDGYAVELEIAGWAAELGTFEDVKKAYEKDDAFFKRYGDSFCRLPENRRGRGFPLTGGTSPGLVLCTIVKARWQKDKEHPTAKIKGNRITIPDFGSLFLGELLLSRTERRLTMMRFAMGSTFGGEIEVADIGSDGHTFPP